MSGKSFAGIIVFMIIFIMIIVIMIIITMIIVINIVMVIMVFRWVCVFLRIKGRNMITPSLASTGQYTLLVIIITVVIIIIVIIIIIAIFVITIIVFMVIYLFHLYFQVGHIHMHIISPQVNISFNWEDPSKVGWLGDRS